MAELSLDDLTNIAIGSARGAKRQVVQMSYVRDLNAGDLDLILNPPPKGSLTTPLARLRASHHFLARLLAEGRRPGECSLMTGYSPSRISILQNDPAFMDLVAYYKEAAEVKYLDVHERLASLGMATLDELQERLEEQPDGFKNRELLELAEFALDRSVTKDARKGGPNGNTAPAINVTFVGQAPGALPQGTLAPSFSRPVEIDYSPPVLDTHDSASMDTHDSNSPDPL